MKPANDACRYCHGARLVGWSGAGPILCPECSRDQDAFSVITQAWREQRAMAQHLRSELAERDAQIERWTARIKLLEARARCAVEVLEHGQALDGGDDGNA